MKLRCEICGDPVDPRGVGTKNHVSGWVELNRPGGGSHGVTLPRYDGRVAHAVCLDKVKRNETLGQSTLLG